MVDSLSKSKNDVHEDSRAYELCQNALSTQLKLEHHFKNIRVRETEFRRAKLLNLDKEARAKELLNAAQAPAPPSGARSAPASPGVSRPSVRTSQASRGREDAGHLSRAWSSPGGIGSQPSRFAASGRGDQPGASLHRFAASVPPSHHPAVHPGAVGLRSPSSPARGGLPRSGSACGAPTLDPQSPDGFAGPSALRSRPPAFASPPGDLDDEPIFGAEGSDLGGRHTRHGESPATIAKLGELMALLGPRYKTVTRDKLWALAANTETPLQRRLRRTSGLASDTFGASSPFVPHGARDVLEDPDGKPRAAWLAARSEGRDQRNQG